jgi:hypothetical protein
MADSIAIGEALVGKPSRIFCICISTAAFFRSRWPNSSRSFWFGRWP